MYAVAVASLMFNRIKRIGLIGKAGCAAAAWASAINALAASRRGIAVESFNIAIHRGTFSLMPVTKRMDRN